MSTSSTRTNGRLTTENTRAPWLPDAGESVVVYGAGGFAHSLVAAVRGMGGDVRQALDRRGSSASFDGIHVYRPDEDPMSVSDRRTATAIVGVFNRDADPFEIDRLLDDSGYGRVVGVPELFESFGAWLADPYWLASRSFYREHDSQISEVRDLWADAASRDLYDSVIRYRVEWNAADAPRPCSGVQYFADDVPRTTAPLSWVDCGAFDGDTLESIASLGVNVAEAYAFEPDTDNFGRLAARSREFARQTGARVSLWPCAVTDSTGVRRFHAAVGEASALSPDGTNVVSAIAIDDALPNAVVTDVKMDIEGAELEALHGAEGVIKRCRPRLAICAYHRPQDLWEIPLFVREFDLSYDMYLRSHGHYDFDLVMYAVPRRAA